MAVNQYDAGFTLYTSAIATCVTAGALSDNPLLRWAVRTITVSIGTLFSSPSDIDDAGEKWKGVGGQLLEVNTALKAADSKISEKSWKNMGEKEYREALKLLLDEIEKLKPLTDNTGGALKQLAMLSMVAAGFCMVGASLLLTVTAIGIASGLVPGLKLAWTAVQLSVANLLSKTIISIIKNNALAMGMIVGAIMMVSSFFTDLLGDKLSKAASPTAAGSTPNFEEVVIKGLPTAPASPYASGSGGAGGLSGAPRF
ncbi:hypothetical protein AB0M44_08290 [Streptosporangium subroseum]|uniref:hypothetical protein n=1 Tax=Streptosporangium subroseum TaxID=106412 RepID=UPI00343E8594